MKVLVTVCNQETYDLIKVRNEAKKFNYFRSIPSYRQPQCAIFRVSKSQRCFFSPKIRKVSRFSVTFSDKLKKRITRIFKAYRYFTFFCDP